MNDYLATFHTHLSAMLSAQALTEAGAETRMGPVPRQLSSSCGTCVRYRAARDLRERLDAECEALYREAGGTYQEVFRNE